MPNLIQSIKDNLTFLLVCLLIVFLLIRFRFSDEPKEA